MRKRNGIMNGTARWACMDHGILEDQTRRQCPLCGEIRLDLNDQEDLKILSLAVNRKRDHWMAAMLLPTFLFAFFLILDLMDQLEVFLFPGLSTILLWSLIVLLIVKGLDKLQAPELRSMEEYVSPGYFKWSWSKSNRYWRPR